LQAKEYALLDTASELSAMEMELQVLISTHSLFLPLQTQTLAMFLTVVEFTGCETAAFPYWAFCMMDCRLSYMLHKK